MAPIARALGVRQFRTAARAAYPRARLRGGKPFDASKVAKSPSLTVKRASSLQEQQHLSKQEAASSRDEPSLPEVPELEEMASSEELENLESKVPSSEELYARLERTRRALRRQKNPSGKALERLEREQLAYEARKLEEEGVYIPPQYDQEEDPFAALSISAGRRERNIGAVALQQLRRALIEEKTQADLESDKTELPALDDTQRSLRHYVDREYDTGEHGKHIWIFCHLRTKQVIYSLENKLSQSSLSQLNFVGKKSVPSHLRPDYWHCIATVSFPSRFQGLHAYRCLREFRLMHEHCWEYPEMPPSKLTERFYCDPSESTEGQNIGWNTRTIPPTRSRDKHWQDMLPPRRNRTAIPKWELTRMLQNQRANSVADLAATLHMQERKGAEEMENWREKWKKWDELDAKEWRRTETLARLKEEGEIPVLQTRVQELEEQLPQMEDEEAKDRTLREIERSKHEIAMMEKAPAKIELRQSRKREMEERARERVDEFKWENEEKKAFVQELMSRMLYHYHYTKFSKEIIPGTDKFKDRGWRAKILLDKLYPMKRSFFSMQGVEIRWADELDMAHAESWPEDVRHIISGQYLHYGAWHPELLYRMEELQRVKNELDSDPAEESQRLGEYRDDESYLNEPEPEKPSIWQRATAMFSRRAADRQSV